MIQVAVLAALLIAAADADPAARAPAAGEERISACVLNEISRLEHTTPDKLDTFSKRSANKAMAACGKVKADWAKDLDARLQTDPAYANPALRRARVGEIIGADELSVMLLVGLKGR